MITPKTVQIIYTATKQTTST